MVNYWDMMGIQYDNNYMIYLYIYIDILNYQLPGGAG